MVPEWLTSAQILLLDAGLLLTLYVCWRVASQYAGVRAKRDGVADTLGSAIVQPVRGGRVDSIPADADAGHVALRADICTVLRGGLR